ncbi:MAG: hypothetical protein GYA21_13290 [Myxococcales bacterium]|nr:hypothetical protein [Myxococcales bacterium]
MVLCAIAVLAAGQQGFARGKGIKAGEGRLHLLFSLDLVYDTNPGYFPEDATGDLVLKIRPGFALNFPSESVSFDMNAKVGYDRYLGVQKAAMRDLSAVAGEADLKLGINPNGTVSFFLEDVFSRTGDPRYTSFAGKFNRTDNEAKVHFQLKPGGGAMMFDLAYGFFLDWFDDSGVNATALSSYAHRAYFSGKWKFLPKTAVAIDFDADLRRYPNAYQDGSQNMDVNAIRATVGLLGQITPTLSLVVKAGYGDSLLPSRTGYTGSGYRSAIGQAELSYTAGTTFLQFGYSRNFQPVVLFVYFGQDRIYGRFRQQIAGKFALSADVGFDFLSYGTSIQTASPSDRTDYFLTARVAADYYALEWLNFGLGYSFQGVFTDYTQPLNGSAAGYQKHMIDLHVGIDY